MNIRHYIIFDKYLHTPLTKNNILRHKNIIQIEVRTKPEYDIRVDIKP